jgi:hypothetical protein
MFPQEPTEEYLERLEVNKLKSDLVENLKSLQVLVRGSTKDTLELVRPKILELLKEMGG